MTTSVSYNLWPTAVTPSTAKYNAHTTRPLQAHRLIENFFAKLKLYRPIATRYDKTVCNFLAAIHLAASIFWLI